MTFSDALVIEPWRKEIGSRLKISPKTVENHRAWVMERIGARNIAELVRIAMKVQGKP